MMQGQAPVPVLAYDATHINLSLGQTPILKDISFKIGKGIWVAIVGPNGAGKTSLLKVMAGIDHTPHAITCNGRDLYRIPVKERARLISWLSQEEKAVGDICVEALVMLGRLPYQTMWSHPSEQDKEIVNAALHKTGLWCLRHRPLSTLSGGEKQRVYIARALAVQAEIYLMDEPLNNLDPQHQSDWLDLIKELTSAGKTVISVMHELTTSLRSDEIMVIRAGQLLHHGDSSARQTHQVVEDVFEQRIAIHEYMHQWIVLPR